MTAKANARSGIFVSAALVIAMGAPASAQAQTCGPSQLQLNHDANLAADCASGPCVERVCVDTLYRKITACGHGFGATPTLLLGGTTLTVLRSVPASASSPYGAMDDAILAGLDETTEGHHKLVVMAAGLKSEPFFVKIGELAGPQGPPGAQGPQGPTGPQGPKGDSGANGATFTSCPPDALQTRWRL